MLGVLSPRRLILRTVTVVTVVALSYLAVNAVLVWLASRRDQARPVQAIIVLGAAQYDGVPSPDLEARLDHALALWKRGLAPVVVVTGGKEPSDRYTEATAGADWLAARGVPQSAILREVAGRNSWESLASSADFLHQRGIHTVLLVSDPFHDERISLMARELGLTAYVSPTRTSPIKGWATVPYFAKESVEVAVGRIIGFRRLTDLDHHFALSADSWFQPGQRRA
jgi:uncharacterized SAM-binding protein YcdF (DUF218 family)